jgi:hypothetical protein
MTCLEARFVFCDQKTKIDKELLMAAEMTCDCPFPTQHFDSVKLREREAEDVCCKRIVDK